MYLAVGGIIVGQALVLGRLVLLLYAAAFFATVAAFVHWYRSLRCAVDSARSTRRTCGRCRPGGLVGAHSSRELATNATGSAGRRLEPLAHRPIDLVRDLRELLLEAPELGAVEDEDSRVGGGGDGARPPTVAEHGHLAEEVSGGGERTSSPSTVTAASPSCRIKNE